MDRRYAKIGNFYDDGGTVKLIEDAKRKGWGFIRDWKELKFIVK